MFVPRVSFSDRRDAWTAYLALAANAAELRATIRTCDPSMIDEIVSQAKFVSDLCHDVFVEYSRLQAAHEAEIDARFDVSN